MMVQTGPFKGMRIADRASWGDGDLTPKLLGVYEEELHPALLRMAGETYGAVVVVGCAEGFYAVGAAQLFPRIPVLAYDIDPNAVAITMENAALSDVAGRILPGGLCTAAELEAAARQYGRLLIICDCEGYEAALLTAPSTRAALACSDLIVECHDFIDPSCTAAILAAYGRSHVADVIYSGGRNPNQFAFLADFNDLSRWLAVNENRPCLMNWVVARSRRR